jgi:hypothetical protein
MTEASLLLIFLLRKETVFVGCKLNALDVAAATTTINNILWQHKSNALHLLIIVYQRSRAIQLHAGTAVCIGAVVVLLDIYL